MLKATLEDLKDVTERIYMHAQIQVLPFYEKLGFVKEGDIFKGTAIVFNSEEDMLTALENHEIKKGDVVVIRYEGPKGGPGMPEMLTPTSAIVGAGLGQHVALLTDWRFWG